MIVDDGAVHFFEIFGHGGLLLMRKKIETQ
jgi:hypothetical protein